MTSFEPKNRNLGSSALWDERILKIVREAPNHCVRPSRVASQLAMSHADATEQLCFLLQAVGSAATFRFEDIPDSSKEEGVHHTANKIMTFQFPPDFEQRLQHRQKVTKFVDTLYQVLKILIKFIKVVIALGFVLSLFVVTVLCTLIFIGIFVAMLTQGQTHENQTRQLFASSHRIRSIIVSLRDVLWFYAVFGDCGLCQLFGRRNDDETGAPRQDPFFRELAQDISLILSLCCIGPSGGWGLYWGVHRLQQRRLFVMDERRREMGQNASLFNDDTSSQIPGVYVWNRGGSWRNSQDTEADEDIRLLMHSNTSVQQEINRTGFVSIAIEFLFGPVPFWPGPSDFHKWKLREYFIVDTLSSQNIDSIRLEQFLPYCDNPPSADQYSDIHESCPSRRSQQFKYRFTTQCLGIVSYFAGIPSNGQSRETKDNILYSSFIFPELMLESGEGGLLPHAADVVIQKTEDRIEHWTAFLYDVNKNTLSHILPSSRSKGINSSIDVPAYLTERYHSLTKLSPSQFFLCCGLGVANLVGILTLETYFQTTSRSIFRTRFIQKIISIFHVYAWLFLLAPITRACFIFVLNISILRRNRRRKQWAEKLNQLQ